MSGYEGETIDLPAGWQRCDGTVIGHPSPWAGKLTPDLNNEKRFLRGGHDSEQLTLEEDSVVSHGHSAKDKFFLGIAGNQNCPEGSVTAQVMGIANDPPSDDKICERDTGEAFGAEETKPKNMNVIFIIRVF